MFVPAEHLWAGFAWMPPGSDRALRMLWGVKCIHTALLVKDSQRYASGSSTPLDARNAVCSASALTSLCAIQLRSCDLTVRHEPLNIASSWLASTS